LELLPDGPELGSWQKEGDAQSFEGEDLFDYIDGGAEVYFEYGFERVIVQEYKDESVGRASLEIFEMDSAESAYGIFTFKASSRGEAVALGDEGQLADYYLNFWKGRYLVTITGLDQDSASKTALMALARLAEKRLTGRGQRPELVSLLPEEDLEPQSLKLFKGPLALSNSYPFFREDVFSFQIGIKGGYTTGCSLFLFAYADEGTANIRFADVRRRFSAEPRYGEVRWAGGRLWARDDRGRALLVAQLKRYIVIVLGDGQHQAAEALLGRAEKRLAEEKEES